MKVNFFETKALMKRIIFLGILFTFIFASNNLIGQPRANYPVLNTLNRAPSSFLDQFYLPGQQNKTEVNFIFKINYDKLNFRRNRIQENGIMTEDFVSEIELIFDLYEKDTPLVPDRAFIARESWASVVRTSSYEHTQSGEMFIEGVVKVQIEPNDYRLITTLLVNGQEIPLNTVTSASASMAMNSRRTSRKEAREATIQRSIITVPDFSTPDAGSIIVLNSKRADGSYNLMNLGNNVKYAHDFNILAITNKEAKYDSLVFNMVEIGPTLDIDNSYERFVLSANLSQTGTPVSSFEIKSDSNRISLVAIEDTLTYAGSMVSIPNHKFKNSWFRLVLSSYSGGKESILAKKNILTRWFDIPTSLLNLDVALDNMKYIADDSTLKELKRGNASEKEAKFRTFWNEKDPTPDTDYNELMSEYYKRIDDAYTRFTTPTKPGYDSDQGKIYIVYGPPENVDRRFPPNGVTQEIWQYGSRTFIFNATSGFGDFELVTQ